METQVKTIQSIYPAVRYNDAKAGIAWLTRALGFLEQEVCHGDGESIAHAELKLAGNLIMLGSVKNDAYGKSPADLHGITGTIYIGLETNADLEAAYARAKNAGAEFIRELGDTDYGSRDFAVRDPEGHVWSFGTYRPQAT